MPPFDLPGAIEGEKILSLPRSTPTLPGMNSPAWGRWRLSLSLAPLLILGASGVGGISSASAQTSEELSCYSGKLGASSYHAKQLAKCHSKLAKGGTMPIFDSCEAAVVSKSGSRIASTDAAAQDDGFDCPGDLTTLALDGPAAWQVGLVETAIFQANGLPNACVQKRASALGKFANKYARCLQRGYGLTPPEIDACATNAVAAFSSSWTKAAAKVACTSDSFASVQAAVEAAIDAQAALLRVVCGDGVQAGFEACDDGNMTPGDGCENDCVPTLLCGNGILQPANNEECDDNNLDNGDGCDSNCIVEECGNGVQQFGEACDGGGETAACDDDCTAVSCGDGNSNEAAGEQCDTSGASASCDANCTVAECGDGTFNALAGEQCDGGGETASCDADCTTASCGDGTTNVTRGEQCDDSGESATCDANCTTASCGDGTTNVTRGEQCDTSGASASCDADCTTATCGDGTFNVLAGEQCDTAGVSATCDPDCSTPSCGDSYANIPAGESCDTGGASMTCDANCTPAQCGDSTLNVAAGESCDTGGETLTCDADCTAPVCGDTVLNEAANEECDDGNVAPSDGCNEICQLESCGDGVRQASEECDDWNQASGDGCSASCLRETCGTVGMGVECLYCPEGSSPNGTYTDCVCDPGYDTVGDTCQDIDECALDIDGCPVGDPCVNLPGTFSCSIDCNQTAFHAALSSCGAPSGTITFDCTNTTIPIADAAAGPRNNNCNGLVVDGLDRNITFEMNPKCWGRVGQACQVDLNPDLTCDCPSAEGGTIFMSLNGNDQAVRNLTVRWFFDGIHTTGYRNKVENVTFDRICDEAFGNYGGAGNVFEGNSASLGCNKCEQNYGNVAVTNPNPLHPEHYNSISRDNQFTDCFQPIRVNEGGRYLVEYDDILGTQPTGIFTCLGPRFDGNISNGHQQFLKMIGSSLEGCINGLRIAGSVEAELAGNTFTNNGNRGVRVFNAAKVSMRDNFVLTNGGNTPGGDNLGVAGVVVVDSAVVDLGGGSLTIDGDVISSPGRNTICGNVNSVEAPREVQNFTAVEMKAENNWWCTMTPVTSGLWDITPLLTEAP